MSIRATKDAVRRGLTAPVEEAIVAQWTYPAMAAMLASEDYEEGPVAFTRKRAPVWKGR